MPPSPNRQGLRPADPPGRVAPGRSADPLLPPREKVSDQMLCSTSSALSKSMGITEMIYDRVITQRQSTQRTARKEEYWKDTVQNKALRLFPPQRRNIKEIQILYNLLDYICARFGFVKCMLHNCNPRVRIRLITKSRPLCLHSSPVLPSPVYLVSITDQLLHLHI